MTPVWEPRAARDEDIRASECPGGPLLVRGADEVVSPDGERRAVRRAVVALCRCDASTIAPWCDGSHKVVRPSPGTVAGPA
ncbi:CDGSH iron-sulfur domain-containing protein [Cellulomonas sp. DKR-3]|uniref:CDGSH iron-sulfur domain-containing protein n=1 Tax=Cellulomonas fulva TaxID=2835530 RepID=A0ABS5TZQ3_9CELL|nr:CDGSH iron-sulfur domain-containing protein [Cellulomonas fulva]MBT0994511.1 CDGSH iron-sulfur domain-containing protein [Cellulomonas fulva]